MSSPYTKTKHISSGSGPSKGQKIAKRLLYLCTICLFLAAVYTVLKDTKRETTENIESELPHGSLDALSDPRTFMEAYLLVNCNAELLESIHTIFVAGIIDNGDSTQDFQLMKKRPHFMRLSVEQPNLKLTVGLIDDFVWKRMSITGRSDVITEVEGDEADAWRAQGRFFDRIISAHLGEGRILSVEPSEWKGEESLKVLTDNPADVGEVAIYVNPRTMRPTATRQTFPSGEVKETVMSDYKIIEGLPLPFKVESFVDGVLESSILLDSARLNSGLLPRLFEAPEELQH